MQRKAEEQSAKRYAELQSSLEVERANVIDLRERLALAQSAARSVSAPLREVEQLCRELEGKRMAEGRELKRLGAIVAVLPAAEAHSQTQRQLRVQAAEATAARVLCIGIAEELYM